MVLFQISELEKASEQLRSQCRTSQLDCQTKQAVIDNYESQLERAKRQHEEEGEEIMRLEEQVRDLNTQLNTTHAQKDSLQHSVSTPQEIFKILEV